MHHESYIIFWILIRAGAFALNIFQSILPVGIEYRLPGYQISSYHFIRHIHFINLPLYFCFYLL